MKRWSRLLLGLLLVTVIGLVVWNDWFRTSRTTHVALLPMTETMVEREIVGIGAVLRTEDETGALQIVDVLPNSPAAKAGIARGSIIQSIDGKPTEGLGLGECVKLIRGPAGTKLRLELVDLERNVTNTTELTRARVELPPGG